MGIAMAFGKGLCVNNYPAWQDRVGVLKRRKMLNLGRL
jgi:hypothetical protein